VAKKEAKRDKDTQSGALELTVSGRERIFHIDDPKLPHWIKDNALKSDNYPYEKKLPRELYEEVLRELQIELVKLQRWQQETGERIILLFEGRDAAGKGGSINVVRAFLNPRSARIVALPKPTETERGQWYYQRYVDHFPSTGEMVLFDRSWYNRASVEPVMGFCTEQEYQEFLAQTPTFEKLPTSSGIHLFKFWLCIGQEMQLKRFHERRHNPLKAWKLSDMDIASLSRWDDYTEKRNRMLATTHTDHAPWMVVRSNDKRRARINIIRHVLSTVNYDGKNERAIETMDSKIIEPGATFLL